MFLIDKAIAFSVRIVNCFKYLQEDRKEFLMSKQILRSGTSIGANAHEAIFAQSKADFISKLSISLKEASETSYWLTILYKTEYLDKSVYMSMKKDIDEIIRLLIASIKTTKKNEKYTGEIISDKQAISY
jgi:four helix bundle protein